MNAPQLWESGAGLGRMRLGTSTVMVIHRPGSRRGAIATVDDTSFADLPELLSAASGDPSNIQPGAVVEVIASQLLSPVGRPHKVICIGQNYVEHVNEGGRSAPPTCPDIFAKWDNALTGPYTPIELPAESAQIDYESELVIVVGRRCRRVSRADVPSVVFGYTTANDGSVRDYQFRTTQRMAGKIWDGLTPMGPVIVPADQVGGVEPDLRITGLLNGEVVQDDRTSRMVFSVSDLITDISTMVTLEPGDVILTGTPAGVGFVRTPPRMLRDGDQFEVRIEGLGSLCNTFVSGEWGG